MSRLCVILFTISSQDHSYQRYLLRKMAKGSYWKERHVRFMYINEDVQWQFNTKESRDLELCKDQERALKVFAYIDFIIRNWVFFHFRSVKGEIKLKEAATVFFETIVANYLIVQLWRLYYTMPFLAIANTQLLNEIKRNSRSRCLCSSVLLRYSVPQTSHNDPISTSQPNRDP